MGKFIKKYILVIIAAIYVLSPIDLIPDSLLLYGLGDDLLMVVLVFLKLYLARKRKVKRKEPKKAEETFKVKDEVLEGELVEG